MTRRPWYWPRKKLNKLTHTELYFIATRDFGANRYDAGNMSRQELIHYVSTEQKKRHKK